MLALKGLDSGQFVATHGALSLLSALCGLPVDFTHVAYLGLKVGIIGWRQPVTDAMGLQIPLLSSRCAWRGEIVATMPRCMSSSAISRPVHWLMGRPDFSGAAQANATI
jgi:hypothetical protein